MKYFKINSASQFKHLEYSIGALLTFVAYLWYLKYTGGTWSVFIMISFVVVFLPAVVIHLEYFIINYGMIIKYDDNNDIIMIISKRNERTIYLKDIDKIIYNRSRSYLYNSWKFFPTDEYHYCKLILKSGESLIITSIMAPGFKIKKIENLEIKQRFIAFVFSEFIPSPNVTYDQIKKL